MVTVAKDAAEQLYRALFARLTGDAALQSLLGGSEEDPHVYQTSVDFESATALSASTWITYNISYDRPAAIEQITDVRQMLVDVHIWHRGPGSDAAGVIEKRVRELLDDADISSPELFIWQFWCEGYYKTFEPSPNLWHIQGTYTCMCMAMRQ